MIHCFCFHEIINQIKRSRFIVALSCFLHILLASDCYILSCLVLIFIKSKKKNKNVLLGLHNSVSIFCKEFSNCFLPGRSPFPSLSNSITTTAFISVYCLFEFIKKNKKRKFVSFLSRFLSYLPIEKLRHLLFILQGTTQPHTWEKRVSKLP